MYPENRKKKMSVKKNVAQIDIEKKLPHDEEPAKQESLHANFYGKKIIL